MIKQLLAASVAAVTIAGAAGAATLSGTFTVEAVNATGMSGTASQATLANFNAAWAGTDLSPGTPSAFVTSTFTYTGALDFDTRGQGLSGTTISQFLDTGTGSSNEVASFGGLLNSSGSIGSSTATTTFYKFTAVNPQSLDFSIVHDDGVAVFDDNVLLGASVGPNSVLPNPTLIDGFDGGTLSFLYVSTNSDPSVFIVDATTPVPLPAAGFMLLAGLGGLAALRRKKAPTA